MPITRNCEQVAGKGLKSPFLGRETQSEERRDVRMVDKLPSLHERKRKREKNNWTSEELEG